MEFPLELKFLNLICEFMIKSSLALAVSLLLVFLFRKKSASMRHFLLSFSLISLLLFPFLSSITPGWKTSWLPSWQTVKPSSLTFNDREKNKDPLIHLDQKDNTSQANGIQPSGIKKTKHQNEKSVFLKTIDSKKLLGLSLITIWTSGLIFLLIRIFLGLYGAHRLTRQGKRISGSLWQLLQQHFLNAISIRRKISLFSHNQVRLPLTWGVIKPIVMMPAEARNWTKDQCSSALFHELSHIKRNDFLIKILARFICSLYWFNPLSWFVFRLMKKEQEKACDELVLKTGVKPSTYAANLLSIKKAGQIRWNPPNAVLGAVGKSQLNERLLVILKQQLSPKEVKMKTKILLSFFIIMVITFIGLAQPSQSAASNKMIILNNDTSLTESQNPLRTDNAQETQEKKESETAEKKESTDKKDKKKEITCVSIDGKSTHVSIYVGEDDKGNKIIITGKPIVIIEKDHPEKGTVLIISGKDIVLKKREKGHWTIKADKLHLINEDEAKLIKFDRDNAFSITIKKGKDGKTIHLINSPEIHIKKALKAIKSHAIHIEGKEGEKKSFHIAPHIDVLPVPHLALYPLLHLEDRHKDLREKLKKLRERLKEIRELQDMEEKAEAQEEALKDIEEALKELSEELDKKPEELKDIKLKVKTDLKHKLLDKFKHIENIKVNLPCIEIQGDKKIISFVDKDEGFQMIIKSKLDNENKGKHDDFLKRLKESLPEDYKVESKINEEDNTVTVKITSGKKDEKTKKEVKKIVKEIVDELS